MPWTPEKRLAVANALLKDPNAAQKLSDMVVEAGRQLILADITVDAAKVQQLTTHALAKLIDDLERREDHV